MSFIEILFFFETTLENYFIGTKNAIVVNPVNENVEKVFCVAFGLKGFRLKLQHFKLISVTFMSESDKINFVQS